MIDVELEISEDQIVILSEISPSHAIDLDLSVTTSILSSTDVQRPEDAFIFLSGTDLPAEATAFIYSRNTNKYELRNRDFRPSPGQHYFIRISFPNDQMGEIRASTFIPEPITIARANVIAKNELEVNSGLVDVVFDVEIELGGSRNEQTFLQIIPERIFSQFKIDVTGEVQITFFAETEPLQVLNILESPNAINELIHKEGVFIDYSKLQNNMVKLRLSTTTLLDPNIDVLQSMEVIVHTIARELYDYHQSLHKQLINNATPFTTPVSSFSNIENGLGVFGGFSTTNSLIKL